MADVFHLLVFHLEYFLYRQTGEVYEINSQFAPLLLIGWAANSSTCGEEMCFQGCSTCLPWGGAIRVGRGGKPYMRGGASYFRRGGGVLTRLAGAC